MWSFRQNNCQLLIKSFMSIVPASTQFVTVSYSTKVSQNEAIFTLFSPRVFSDNVFDGYDEIFVLYSHLPVDKTHTVSGKRTKSNGNTRRPYVIDFILGFALAVHDAIILQCLQGFLLKLP